MAAPNNILQKRIFGILGVLLVLSILIISGILFYPNITTKLLLVLWQIVTLAVLLFLGLGILVVVGRKKEVLQILDILLQGSLTFIDFVEFLKKLKNIFLEYLLDFMIFISPLIAYLLSIISYILLLVLYKIVGSTYDVTLLTIVLAIFLTLIVGLFNKPNGKAPDSEPKRIHLVKESFSRAFSDSFEVVIFIFFITMDSTKLFFLPESLNIPLSADIGGYNLMVRSFEFGHAFKATLNVIVVAIGIEIFRNFLRILFTSKRYFARYRREYPLELRSVLIKRSAKEAFSHATDDIIKFITYTTVLLGVFLLFPRLKLIALLAVSTTSLILDLVLPSRLTEERGKDLISRLLAKVFRI